MILSTIHGSILYGLDHEDSDRDMYYVTRYGKATQTVTTTDGQTADVVVTGLDEFLRKIHKGTHQAVEALFSHDAYIAPEWRAYFNHMYVYSPVIEETYDRTVRHLAAEESFKRRRHAVRIAFCLQDLRDFGKFDPRMTPERIAVANRLASTSGDLIDLINEEVFTRVRSHVEREKDR